MIILCAVVIAAAAAVAFGGAGGDVLGDEYVLIALIVPAIAVGACLLIYSFGKRKFQQLFREKIVRNFVESLLQNGYYNPLKFHSLNEYYESLLYPAHVDRFKGANYASGKYEKTQLSFSFLHTEYEKVEHTKNGTRKRRHTIFKGVFLCADCNKNFSAATVVLPDFAEKYFGGFGKWLQRTAGNAAGQMVYMENPDFEKAFAVYSADPVEARYLITPKMQEDILRIKKFLGKDVRFSFVNSKVFVAISRDDLFKVNPSLSFAKPETLDFYMKDMFDLLSVVKMLDLNVRIWGKS
ncbi:MAG: DUF3137 domain-containing protein [Prevotellaceae bacterium]|nr:DUF3137 domain-containing protein [Prevotellaceae bacterium]